MQKPITQEDLKIWCEEVVMLGRDVLCVHAPYTGIDFISKIGTSPYGSKTIKKIIKNNLYETIKEQINKKDTIVDLAHGKNNSWITVHENKKQKINWTKTFKSISLEK